MTTARDFNQRTRYATPAGFCSDVVPAKHLRQFSCRLAGVGTGAVPGSVTVSAGAVTAIAAPAAGFGGSGYTSNTVRVLIVGDGTGAAATATLSGGVVTAFSVTAGGTGYTAATAYVVDGPVVVLVGDSISTEEPSPSNFGASMWFGLTAAIRDANRGRNITFFNRAVGSQTWTTFNGVANANLPSWYSGASKDWMDYIEELKPDLVVCAFGMNDRQDFVFSQFQAAITKLLAFEPEPDIVLVTPMVPSADSADTTISSTASQNGRDATAAYLRGWASVYSYGLVDLNRRSRLLRDGADVRLASLRRISSATAALPWTATTTAETDFSLWLSFAGVDASWWTSQVLTIRLGTDGSNTVTELLISQSSSRVRLVLRDRQTTLGSINQWTLDSVASPTGTVTFGILVQDTRLLVQINGATVCDQPIARFAGSCLPKVEAVTATISPTLTYCAGEWARYSARMEDADIWGTSDGDYRGNAANHPSALGVSHLIMPVLYETDWSHTPVVIGQDSNDVTTNIGIGKPDPQARLHVARLPMTSAFTPASDANTTVLEDVSDVGLSLLTEATGACRIKMGDAANPSQWTEAYAHSTDLHTEVHGSTTVRTTSATVTAFGIPVRLPVYTVAGVPSAATAGQGALIQVSNETGGSVVAFSDGTSWRRVTDRAVVS